MVNNDLPPTDAETRKRLERAQTIALTHFEHVERQVQLAATKASLIVAADALMLNVYLKAVTDYKVFITLGNVPSKWFFVAGALLVFGFITALLAVFPNVWGARDGIDVLFYGSIARAKRQDYINAFWAKAHAGELDNSLLVQIHGKSCWLKRMFVLTAISISSIVVGTFICTVVLYQHANMLPGLGKGP